MMVCSCDPSTWEIEATGSLPALVTVVSLDQPGYIVWGVESKARKANKKFI